MNDIIKMELDDNIDVEFDYFGHFVDEDGEQKRQQKETIGRNYRTETEKKTVRDVSKFQRWILAQGETRDVEQLPADQLDSKLGKYLIEMRKPDGKEYEPGSLDSFFYSLKRHLEMRNYKWSLITDKKFKTSREVLASKKKELKSKGMGKTPNKAEPITPHEEELLWQRGAIGDHSPDALRDSLWYLTTKCFGLRGVKESRQLKMGDLEERVGSDGKRYIQFRERAEQGQEDGLYNRVFDPKLWANEEDITRCPLRLLELYKAHRPADMLGPDSPFFLSVNNKRQLTSEVWYTQQAMGVNELGKIMRNMSVRAGLTGKKTNNSVRKSSCSTLLRAGFPPTVVAKISGHKHVSTLMNYIRPSVDMQKYMFEVLVGHTDTEEDALRDAEVTSPPGTLRTLTDTADPRSETGPDVAGSGAADGSEPQCNGRPTINSNSHTMTLENHAFEGIFRGAKISGGNFNINIKL